MTSTLLAFLAAAGRGFACLWPLYIAAAIAVLIWLVFDRPGIPFHRGDS